MSGKLLSRSSMLLTLAIMLVVLLSVAGSAYATTYYLVANNSDCGLSPDPTINLPIYRWADNDSGGLITTQSTCTTRTRIRTGTAQNSLIEYARFVSQPVTQDMNVSGSTVASDNILTAKLKNTVTYTIKYELCEADANGNCLTSIDNATTNPTGNNVLTDWNLAFTGASGIVHTGNTIMIRVYMTDLNRDEFYPQHSDPGKGEAYNSSVNLTVVPAITDTTPPNVTFVAPTPANGSTINVNYAYINVSVVDDNNANSALLEWNGVNESMTKVGSGATASFYVNKTGLSDGTYTYKVYASDAAGNWNVSETRVLTVSLPKAQVNSTVKDGSGNLLSVNWVAYDADCSTVLSSGTGSSVNVTIPVGGCVEYDAISTKHVKAKFVISADSAPSTVYLDRFLSNPEPTDPPETGIKYVNVSASGMSYSSVYITIYYTDAELGSLYEPGLNVYHYKAGSWNLLPTTRDAANNLVTGTATSLSTFGAAGSPPQLPDTGRYNISKPAIVEITNPQQSCYRAQAATTATSPGCHMINWSNQYIGVDQYIIDNKGAGIQIKHPGSERSPAAMYPGWVHRIHGQGNWPQWQVTAGNGGTGWITTPQASTLISGNSDASIGSGTAYSYSRDYDDMACPGANDRTNYAAENVALMYPWANPLGPNANGNCNPYPSGNSPTGQKRNFKLEGCSADGGVGSSAYGCHSTSESNNYLRTDSPACSQCHFTIGNVTSSNSKHGTAAGAGGSIGCADCHDAAGTATNDILNNQFLPVIRQCYECHTGTKVGPTVNTTGLHAGKDCRYCHGHGHNITRDYSWNVTCGNGDSICHGVNAPSPRNIGGGANFAHGSSLINVSCGNCHIPEASTQGAHNITIPACRKCHNETGTGNASVGSSSRYGITGDNRNYTVPNWDSSNNIYHDGSRGDVAGLNCTFCHVPDYPAGASYSKAVHYINVSQDNGKNYVPDCRSTACHGNATTMPTGKGTWIKYAHGENLINETNYGKKLTCLDCHNNYSLFFIDNTTGNYIRVIDTLIHTTANSGYNITPFNITRINQTTGEVSYTACLLCHNTTQYSGAGDCGSCHKGSDGVLNIHDPDMGVAGQLVLDGQMAAAGGPDCASCHGGGPGGAPDINWTSFEAGVHANLNANATNTTNLTRPSAKACWACHGDGSEPSAHPVNQTTPWHCEDCHVKNGTNYDKYGAPEVGAHVPTNASFSNATLWTNGSKAYCTDCHKNDIGDTSGTEPGTTLNASLIANVSHYAGNQTIKSEVKFTLNGKTYTNCTYCHYNASNAAKYGGAPDPRATKNHKASWNTSKCGACHYHSLAGSLHDPGLTGEPDGGPDCVFCHSIENGANFYPNATKVNVSAMNQSYALHYMLNNRSGTPGYQDTGGWDWNNRRCWACHAAGNSTASFGATPLNNHPANYRAPFNCTNCHINGSSGNDVYFVNSPIRNITQHWDGVPTNTSRGQDTRQSIYVPAPYNFNDSECVECHNNSLGTTWTDYNYNTSQPRANVRSNVSHYGINASGTPVIGPGLVQNTATNCTYCHRQNSTAIRALWLTNKTPRAASVPGISAGYIRHETNVTHCKNCHGNISSSIVFHSAQVQKYDSVHYAFDWEGDDAYESSDPASNNYNPPIGNKFESCVACHNETMFGTPSYAYPIKRCIDCHLNASSGPYNFTPLPGYNFDTRENFTLRSDLQGWTPAQRETLGIPIIYSHVPLNPVQNSTTGVDVTSLAPTSGNHQTTYCSSFDPSNVNGSCHGVPFVEQNNSGGGYFAWRNYSYDLANPGYNYSYPYRFTMIPDYMPNTTNCLFCHNQSNDSIWVAWGRAIRIYYNRSNQSQYIGPSLMYGATSNSDCYNCHTTDNAQPENFHASTLQPAAGGPDCISCHDLNGDPNYPTAHRINGTAFALSVHARVNQNATNTTNLTLFNGIAISKACWACHSDGSEPPENTMGTRTVNPRTCYDCHNATKPFANVSNAPTVSEHFYAGSDLRAGTNAKSIVLSCIGCHNKSEMIVPNNDPNFGVAVNDVDGDGVVGGNRSFYHYGKNRSAELRVTRNSSLCGGNANTNCSGWNNFPAGINYTYTNCSYCHQNSSSAFTTAMNYTAHNNMLAHSDESDAPYCTDCHIIYNGSTTIRIHDAALVVPKRSKYSGTDGTGMYNSSLCMACHKAKEVHADSAAINTDKLECASCHANASVYTSNYGEKQVHGIRFINESGVYSEPWNRSFAANCTTCHQMNVITSINASPSAGLVTIPKIPRYFNHSNDPDAGSKWNETQNGYLGPWNVAGAGDNLRACLFCHGMVSKSQTDPDNITNIVHNATSLGRVANAHKGNNTVNGTINSTSKWCGACHYPGNSYYTATTQSFANTGFEIPPDNTNETKQGFFNHSSFLAADDSDAKCATPGCHGGLLSPAAKMDEFAHNVMAGSLENCIACHDAALNIVPTASVNVSVFNSTSPLLNNDTTKKSYNRTLHGDINQDGVTNNSDCKVCHYNTTGMGTGFRVRLYNGTGSVADPNNVSQANTYYCTVCHYDNRTIYGAQLSNGNVTDVGNPPKVTMHAGPNLGIGIVKTASGRNTRTIFSPGRAPACEFCHNNSVAWRGQGDSDLKAAVHYGKYYNLTTIGTNDNNTKACAECHRGDSSTTPTERATWGIGTNRSEGYIGGPGADVQMGSSDETSKFYCWSCHVASNFGLSYAQLPGIAPPNFHNASITIFDFSWQSCNACHA